MTPQEQKLLDDFLTQLAGVPDVPKDRAAAAAIDAAFARQPNAAYLVVQRALLLQQALENTQAELDRIKAAGAAMPARDERPAFLDPNGWGRRNPSAPAAGLGAAGMSAARAPAAAGGMGSFLGQAAAMAAGVAGGAFLFQGIQHLMNRPDAPAAAASGATPAAADATQLADDTRADPGWDDAASDVDDGGFDGGDFLA